MAKIPKDKLLFYIIAAAALIAVFLVVIDITNRTYKSVKLIDETFKKSDLEISKKNNIDLNSNIIIPEPEDLIDRNNDNEEIAIPVRVTEMESGNKQRFFEIRAYNNQFLSKEIMVYKDEIVNIKIIAEDKDYSLLIPDLGISLNIFQGDSQSLEFQAREVGEFNFYCPSCLSDEKEGVIKVY